MNRSVRSILVGSIVSALLAGTSVIDAQPAPAPEEAVLTITGGSGGLFSEATVGRPETFVASATGCTLGDGNWIWSGTDEPAIVGSSTGSATFTWVATGPFTAEISVSNTDCGTVTATTEVRLAYAVEFRQLELVKPPSGMIKGIRESDSFTILYRPFVTIPPATLTFSSDPVHLDIDPPNLLLDSDQRASINVRFPENVVNNATGDLLSTNVTITSSELGGITVATIPIRMLLSDNPTEPARPNGAARVDFARDPGDSRYDVDLSYRNDGEGRLTALLVPSVEWIEVGDDPLVNLAPGESRDITVTIDRTKRPDANAPLGSVSSNLSLLYATPAPASGRFPTAGTAATLATAVTDTASNPTAAVLVPPLAQGEVALFLPGIGHVQGSVGLFISDVSITNNAGLSSVRNIPMYYLPAGSGEAVEAVAPAISADASTSLADVVKQTFGAEGQIGSLQIRPRLPDSISAVATVFNSSNPAGTYGTAIPLFRSDRSAGANETIYITGLRKSTTSHTNLFFQEVSGAPVTLGVRYLDSSGTTVGTGSETLAPFGLLQRSDTAPEGSASVVITVEPSSAGRVVSFATPVDRASGDTWALTDWRRFYDYEGDAPVIVPVAGTVRGANQTYFRTDVAIMNTGGDFAPVTLDYFGRANERVTQVVTVAPGESRFLYDIVGQFLEIPVDSVGAIIIRPSSGDDILVTSRTYTTVEGQPGTFGTGVPTLGLADALRLGDIRRFGGLEDSTFATIAAGRPASFRTNFGIVETHGASARIRATIKYPIQASIISAATLVEASKEYTLAPNQLLLLSNVAREILGDERESTLGDLRNLQVEFAMLEGRAHVFVTSTDNGTGDSVLRTE